MLGPGLLAAISLLSMCTEAMDWNSVARKTVYYNQLEVQRFSKPGIHNYKTLTLNESEGVLYVGAQEAIFALSLSSISQELKPAIIWEAPLEKKLECIQKGKNNKTECFNYIRFLQNYNSSHMYTCGTYAFQPKCSYIELSSFTLDRFSLEDGKGKCPYDPSKGHSSLIVDGALYSATLNDFLGTEPVILRNLGQHRGMKTEYLASWLNEPNFVGSAYVQESVNSSIGDDDKIYFFFSEHAVEYDCYAEQAVARVARVCKGDVGGARTLQKKWTSFLKARLVCSVPEHQLHFNQLQAVYTLNGNTWRDTQFFGVFQACCGEVSMSAVCQYTIEDIQKVFEGPYKEYREQAQKWAQYSDQVPSPRPGSCITNWHRDNGFHSSLELPDNTLNFAKKHPLMDGYVLPRQHKPLLVKKDENFTQLVVDQVLGLDKKLYDVLFIGTGNGWLYKAVNLGSKVHIIEAVQLFKHASPIESLTISHQKKLLFVGSYSEVVQLSVANCSKYLSCSDCILARDPYCAWNRNTSRCVQTEEHDRLLLLQDVVSPDTARCSDSTQNTGTMTPKNITVETGTTVLLPCQLASNLAQAYWTFNGKTISTEQHAILTDSVLKVLFILEANHGHTGNYRCLSKEQNTWLEAEGYYLSVVARPPVMLEASAPLENLGLAWMVVVALGAVCLVLFLLVLYLRQKLKQEMEKSAKSIESTLVYPIELPKEPKSPKFIPSTMSDSDEKLWDPANYYYSDGSLKIVPGHAVCQNGGNSPSPTSNGIPGQPIPTTALHSPNRINLGNIRGSNSNGYIRLNLGLTEERPDYNDVTEELRWKLKQRQALPDANPEESSV
ncbi:semaphorin-4C isoform X2 [Microcaecilia unicolor]|uniref:Semaphorin-4C isoform X2 n=1 Tax=Microcaecilia unicolor TaxID=1415580 RepID=A0A6P7XQ80_9AMPH|nr:semaphorin-4C isoform X2 [Microcaecilia unicolor]